MWTENTQSLSFPLHCSRYSNSRCGVFVVTVIVARYEFLMPQKTKKTGGACSLPVLSCGFLRQPLEHLRFVLRHPFDVGGGLLYGLLQGQRGRAKTNTKVVFFEFHQLYREEKAEPELCPGVVLATVDGRCVGCIPPATRTLWRISSWFRRWDWQRKTFLPRTWQREKKELREEFSSCFIGHDWDKWRLGSFELENKGDGSFEKGGKFERRKLLLI